MNMHDKRDSVASKEAETIPRCRNCVPLYGTGIVKGTGEIDKKRNKKMEKKRECGA